jgi:hypothetical protein
MKYTKYGIAFGLLVVITGVIVTLLVGYRPAPKKIMKPSFFDKPEEIGAVTLKHFYAPLADENVVVLGIPSNRDWSIQLVAGFMMAAEQNSRAFTQVVVEQQLQPELRAEVKKILPMSLEIDTNQQDLTELTKLIEEAQRSNQASSGASLGASLGAKQRLLLIVPNIYSTHLLVGNLMRRLEANLTEEASDRPPMGLFSITVSPLALEAAQEKELDPICIGSERDGSGTADFGCAILQAGRYFYRKRILDKEPNARARFIAIMQSSKPRDYMLMVREPRHYGKKQ